ncbi:DUF1800 domain-containing protein [Sulfidibacter corallicola]
MAVRDRVMETDGNIREVVRTILFHPRFLEDPQYCFNKVKTPLAFAVGMVRAAGTPEDLRTRPGLMSLLGRESI